MPGSGRYADAEVATTAVPDGTGSVVEVRHLRRRLCPDPRTLPVLTRHRVLADDRLDLVAARTLGDPSAWWRIADASGALDPDALVAPDAEGTLLVVPVPGR